MAAVHCRTSARGFQKNIQPEDFYAGESGIYLRVNGELYRSKSNLKVPVWEKENVPNPRSASIAFMRSGVIAYNEQGQIYQKKLAAETWLPTYSTFKNHSVKLGLPNYPYADRRKVFRLYVSGNVLYAVARDSGC